MSIIGGDVESVSTSVPSSTAGSAPATPKNRVKFLCSHGGKILPRPSDGLLKYAGGETRVISVLRHITFSDLMKKLTSMFDGEMILKYQLMPEDLDVLITVKSDEDVRHMIEECDRHEFLGAPRLRAFLFPANQIVLVNHFDHHSLEQRYINSINGIVFNPTSPIHNNNNTFKQVPVNTSYTTFSISSACSSPRSPPETTAITTTNIERDTAFHGKPVSLTRNRSSPSLCNLGNDQTATPNTNQNQIQIHHQQPPQPHHFHPHLYHQPSSQAYHSPKPPHPHKTSGTEQFGRIRTTVGDYYKYQMDYNNTRTNKGGQMYYYQRGLPYDDYYGRYERNDSPPSPGALSSSASIRSGR